MWFNNRVDKDYNIHFVPSEWSCTDPDEMQFCRKISDTEFEYIQLTNDELKSKVEHLGKNALAKLDGITTIADWVQTEINVADYLPHELKEYAEAYGGDEYLGNSKGAERNQLLAECIFEQDFVHGDY